MKKLLKVLLPLVVIVTFFACESKNNKKYISTSKGLTLRETASKNSNSIIIIPYGAEVKVLKTEANEIFMDERYGQWTNIEFSGKTGWLFSGFLSDFDPKIIEHEVANFYRTKYKESKIELEKANPEMYKEFTQFKDDEVKVISIVNDFILLVVPTYTGGGVAKEDGHVIWKYSKKENSFKEVFFNEESTKAKLFYLNDDKYPDAIASWGCCDSGAKYIFFGTQDGLVKHKVISCDGYDDTENYPERFGRCGNTDFACFDSEKGIKSYYKFNCSNNSLDVIREQKIE